MNFGSDARKKMKYLMGLMSYQEGDNGLGFFITLHAQVIGMINGFVPYFKADELVMCNILCKRCPNLEERS